MREFASQGGAGSMHRARVCARVSRVAVYVSYCVLYGRAGVKSFCLWRKRASGVKDF